MLVYVPPTLRPILSFALDDDGWVDPSGQSRRALRAVADARGFKVLDYRDWSDDQALFRDPLHLNTGGAGEFSARFFRDLERVLRSDGADVAYQLLRRE